MFSRNLFKMRLLSAVFVAVLAVSLTNVSCKSIEDKTKDVNGNSWISKFVDKVVHWLKTRGKQVKKQCFDRRKQGHAASAELGDSPLKAFGYPHFNEARRGVVVKAGVPLSYMGGHRQPIKIGSRDYVFAGYPEQILAFCACFENYRVIGESLSHTGHWVDEGNIKIQMQNVQEWGGRLDSSVFELLFKYTLERIIKYLNPVKIIKGIDCKLLGGCDAASTVDKFRAALEKIRGWLPHSADVINKIIEIYQKKEPLEQKAKDLIDFIKIEEEKKAKIRGDWIGWDNIEHKDKAIIVTLTMYDKPTNHVRSTYTMHGSNVSMKTVGEAIKEAFDREK